MRLLTNLSPQTNRSHLALVAVVALLSQTPATADAVVAGSLVLSYDQTGFGALGLADINSFDQATSNTSTRDQIMTDPGTITVWSGIVFGVNPTTPLPNPAGRDLQATTFTYSPGDLTGTATGQIGIGGTTRWTVDPLAGGGQFVLGDYAVQYSSARVGGVYSGWFLRNNFDFSSVSFDLGNVTTVVAGDGFFLTGDLIVRPLSPLTLFGFVGGQDYGDFTLSASTVPEPATWAMLLMGTGVGICLVRSRRSQAEGDATICRSTAP